MTTKVSNPLTIVAIFAGLAEAFATIALIYVPHDIQLIFVYFVMVFPTLIVLIFFAVLIFKHTVLYAPGDFADESMFLESMKFNSLKSDLISNLAISSADSNVPPLTPQQLETVSHKIDAALTKVLDGDVALSGWLKRYKFTPYENSRSSEFITAREQQVIDLIHNSKFFNLEEMSGKLAEALNVSRKTILVHLANIQKKGMLASS